MRNDTLPSDWQQLLQNELQKPYFDALLTKVEKAYESNPDQIFPPRAQLSMR
jgi:uracil DNA glycosylase